MTTNQNTNVAKAAIFSFENRWFEHIIDKKVNVFFRKRGPVQVPSHVLAYVGSPRSSIVSISKVRKVRNVNLHDALSLKREGSICEDELRNYIQDGRQVSAIFITNHQILKNPLSVADVRKIINFHPPQNFLRIDYSKMQEIQEYGNA